MFISDSVSESGLDFDCQMICFGNTTEAPPLLTTRNWVTRMSLSLGIAGSGMHLILPACPSFCFATYFLRGFGVSEVSLKRLGQGPTSHPDSLLQTLVNSHGVSAEIKSCILSLGIDVLALPPGQGLGSNDKGLFHPCCSQLLF